MGKKYRIEPEGNMLRIIALKNFRDVKKGDKGGLITRKDNLSQEGDCWIYPSAMVCGDAKISENARVYGDAQVYDTARVCDNAAVGENALIGGNARVSEDARVYGDVKVGGNARIFGEAEVCGDARVFDNAKVYGSAKISGYVRIDGNAQVYEKAKISGGGGYIYKNAKISGDVTLRFMESIKYYNITTSIKNNKDYSKKYTLLAIKKDFYVISLSNLKSLLNDGVDVSTVDKDYIKNIKTIRQLYGEKI